MLERSTEKYNRYSSNQNVLDHKNLSFWHIETFLSGDAPTKLIPKALETGNLESKTATEGNLLLFLLVRKLCTNTGFYTKMNPRKTRAQCLKT